MGVHLVLRCGAAAGGSWRSEPEHLLVGHGEGFTARAADALRRRARRRTRRRRWRSGVPVVFDAGRAMDRR